MRVFFVLAAMLAAAGVVPAARAEGGTGSLKTVTVQYREVPETYSVEGVVEATRQSTVSAQISGRVKQILFDVGDTVKKGQVILRIDQREAAQALSGSEARVMQAQAALQEAKVNYERARQLFAQKFISQAALDKAQADYQVALARAAASKAGAGRSRIAKGYTAVVAPYSGLVAKRLVEVGEMVNVGTPLMVGFDPTQMRVIVHVPQYKLADIGKHPDVSVELPSLHRWTEAKSVTVQPIADPRTHSTQVRINLSANEAGVYPGMFVRAHFTVGKAKKLLVPTSAVLHRGEVVAVYVVGDKGRLSLRQVRLGETDGHGNVEVVAGLNPGETVAVNAVKAGMVETEQNK